MNIFKILINSQYYNSLNYIECNFLISLGTLGAKKMRLNESLLLHFKKCFLNIEKSVFLNFSDQKDLWGKYHYGINNFFLSILFGYLSGFRIVGRGYKAYVNFNNFVFRLGYSHNVYYSIPLFFKCKKKEKSSNFWLVRSLDYMKLTTLMTSIKNFRIGNIYRIKGIYRMNDVYRLKSGKKGVLL